MKDQSSIKFMEGKGLWKKGKKKKKEGRKEGKRKESRKGERKETWSNEKQRE